MQNKKVLVSAGDQNYFGMLMELINSFRSFSQSSEYDIAIMDVGMRDDQLEILSKMNVIIKKPEWPCDIPSYRIRGREYLKACVCRPFINKIFPDYEMYLWLDTDTWVQDWSSIDMFELGASKDVMACTLLTDRGYPASRRVKWLWSIPYKARGFYYSNAKRAFPGRIARELFHQHTVSAGAFAMKSNIPHWDKWQELVVKALDKGKVFTAEQLSLGVMIYIEKYKAEYLPAWTHWVNMENLLWDKEKKIFVEPYLPNNKLGILHLSGLDEMRKDDKITTTVNTTDGDVVEMSLRYGRF